MPLVLNGANGITFNNSSTQSQSAGMGTSATAQTWQDVTASRAIGTTYTNSTGYPIEVAISCTANGANGLFGVVINGNALMYSPSGAGSGYWVSVSFIVPNGATYSTNQQGANVTLVIWSELR